MNFGMAKCKTNIPFFFSNQAAFCCYIIMLVLPFANKVKRTHTAAATWALYVYAQDRVKLTAKRRGEVVVLTFLVSAGSALKYFLNAFFRLLEFFSNQSFIQKFLQKHQLTHIDSLQINLLFCQFCINNSQYFYALLIF